MLVKLSNTRLSFPALFVPRAFEEGAEAKYSATFIIVPGSSNDKTINAAMLATATEKWGAQGKAVLATLASKDKLFYHTDQKVDSKGDPLAGFEGAYYARASSKVAPLVIDANRSPLTARDGRPYGGCFVNATMDVWAQDNSKFGRRINATLTGVQFVRDGDAFGGAQPAAVDDFEDLAGVDAEDIA